MRIQRFSNQSQFLQKPFCVSCKQWPFGFIIVQPLQEQRLISSQPNDPAIAVDRFTVLCPLHYAATGNNDGAGLFQ